MANAWRDKKVEVDYSMHFEKVRVIMQCQVGTDLLTTVVESWPGHSPKTGVNPSSDF